MQSVRPRDYRVQPGTSSHSRRYAGSPWLKRTLALADTDSAARGVAMLAYGSSAPGSPADACSSVQVPGSTGMGVAVHGDGVGIPSRDLDRGAGLRLQQLRLALAVWRQIQFQLNYFGYDRKHLTKKYYQVLVSVALIGTKPSNHCRQAVRRQYKRRRRNFALGLHFPRPSICSDLLASLTTPYAHTGCRLGTAPRPSPRALRQCVHFGVNFHAKMCVPAAMSQPECAKAFAVSAYGRTEGRAELIRRRGDNSAGG